MSDIPILNKVNDPMEEEFEAPEQPTPPPVRATVHVGGKKLVFEPGRWDLDGVMFTGQDRDAGPTDALMIPMTSIQFIRLVKLDDETGS